MDVYGTGVKVLDETLGGGFWMKPWEEVYLWDSQHLFPDPLVGVWNSLQNSSHLLEKISRI